MSSDPNVGNHQGGTLGILCIIWEVLPFTPQQKLFVWLLFTSG